MNMIEPKFDIDFDKKDPCEKFAQFCGPDIHPRDLCLPLIALHAADVAIKRIFGVESIYFLDDAIVPTVLSSASVRGKSEYAYQLMQLTMAQLIYRFTAATKFAISDVSVKQLRINSWGRDLVERHIMPRYPTEHHACVGSAASIFTLHQAAYSEQISLLTSAISPASARAIAKLNGRLPIQVVS
jgi:hypothetical protein